MRDRFVQRRLFRPMLAAAVILTIATAASFGATYSPLGGLHPASPYSNASAIPPDGAIVHLDIDTPQQNLSDARLEFILDGST
ncbi:MAG: hypothetical protein ACYTGQ_17245, partial [Planctomycetota bacterium]